jgi:hypothetical protein
MGKLEEFKLNPPILFIDFVNAYETINTMVPP